MKKLLLSTALIGALFTGAAVAETKFGGNVESVWRSGSFDKADSKINTQDGMLFEQNISVVTDKALNNGLKLTAGLELENGGDHQSYTTVSNDTFSFGYGLDFGFNINTYGIPQVGDGPQDVAQVLGVSIDDNQVTFVGSTQEAHDAAHFNVTVKAAGGEIGLNYAPSVAQGRSTTTVADAGGSAWEVGYVGSPVPGVKVILGRYTANQADDSVTTTDAKTVDTYAIQYATGPYAVGYGVVSYDTGAATNNGGKTKSIGATYSSDAYSFGLAKFDLSKDGTTSDEEHVLASATYNFGGGLGIELSYDQVDNIGYSAGADGDAIQLRTIVKF